MGRQRIDSRDSLGVKLRESVAERRGKMKEREQREKFRAQNISRLCVLLQPFSTDGHPLGFCFSAPKQKLL